MGQTIWVFVWEKERNYQLCWLWHDGGGHADGSLTVYGVVMEKSSHVIMFSWGFMYCHGTALANKHEFGLISSCLVIVTMALICRVSLIVCVTVEYRHFHFFLCLNVWTFKSVLWEEVKWWREQRTEKQEIAGKSDCDWCEKKRRIEMWCDLIRQLWLDWHS